MSLTLTADITATDRIIRITGTVPDDVVAGYAFRLGDEMLTFQAFDYGYLGMLGTADVQRWHVRRGEGGTVAASHSAGATVYAAKDANVASEDTTPPNSFAAGGGGGGGSHASTHEDGGADEIDVTGLTGAGGTPPLGPFTLTPATPNLIEPEDNGHLIATIAAGMFVRVVAISKVSWSGSDNPGIYIVLAPDVDAPSSTLVGLKGVFTANGTAGGALSEVPPVDGAEPRWGLAEVECGVYAQLFSDSGTPSAGEMDVYLFVQAAP